MHIFEPQNLESYIMKRLSSFLLLAFSLLIFFQCQPDLEKSAGDSSISRPNIILMVADDHSTNDLGCDGTLVIKTPNLDQLAADGGRFNQAFCTTASCSASRSVILTGLYNHSNGQFGHQHAYHHFAAFSNVKSLPVLLSDHGYTTARIGKYHVAPEEVFKFDISLQGNSRNGVQMAEVCKPFIEDNSSNPFFLYFCTSDPHRGGGIVEENQYKPDRFGNRDEGYPGVERNIITPDHVAVPDYLPDNPASRAELSQYYESVNRVDQGIGKLMEIVKEAGAWENTIFIYISDNGIAFPGAKTNLYNPGMRLPCIVRNPLIERKSPTSEAMINWADLTPTILDFAGIMPEKGTLLDRYLTDEQKEPQNWASVPIHRDFHGKSFKKVMETGEEIGWDATYASHTFHEITMYYPMRVVMDRKYKIIWNIASGLPYPHASDLWESATWQSVINTEDDIQMYAGRTVQDYTYRSAFELYDIQLDPLELHNLADNPDFAEVLEDMKTKLKSFQEQTNDPWIIKWEHE